MDTCSDNIETVQYKNGRIMVKAYTEILTSLSNHVILVVLVLLYWKYCICDEGEIKWVIMGYSNSIILCHLENQNSQYKEKEYWFQQIWEYKEDVVFINNEILLGHKKRVEFCHLQQHGMTWRVLC